MTTKSWGGSGEERKEAATGRKERGLGRYPVGATTMQKDVLGQYPVGAATTRMHVGNDYGDNGVMCGGVQKSGGVQKTVSVKSRSGGGVAGVVVGRIACENW